MIAFDVYTFVCTKVNSYIDKESGQLYEKVNIECYWKQTNKLNKRFLNVCNKNSWKLYRNVCYSFAKRMFIYKWIFDTCVCIWCF